MNNYTNETFEAVWHFSDENDESYFVVHDKQADVYKVYTSEDIEEIAYTNYVVKSQHKKLSGFLYDREKYFFVSAKDNLLHCEIGPAAFIPCGLTGFRPREEIKNYLIYGKVMSQYSWLTWIRNTASWAEAMANILGQH